MYLYISSLHILLYIAIYTYISVLTVSVNGPPRSIELLTIKRLERLVSNSKTIHILILLGSYTKTRRRFKTRLNTKNRAGAQSLKIKAGWTTGKSLSKNRAQQFRAVCLCSHGSTLELSVTKITSFHSQS